MGGRRERERGEKIGKEIERENRFGGGGEGWTGAFCISSLESADFSMD